MRSTPPRANPSTAPAAIPPIRRPPARPPTTVRRRLAETLALKPLISRNYIRTFCWIGHLVRQASRLRPRQYRGSDQNPPRIGLAKGSSAKIGPPYERGTGAYVRGRPIEYVCGIQIAKQQPIIQGYVPSSDVYLPAKPRRGAPPALAVAKCAVTRT